MTQQQAEQQQSKTFTCFSCKQQIKLKRKDDDSGWLRFNLDGTTTHECGTQKKSKNRKEEEQGPQQDQQPPKSTNEDLANEVAEIRKQLLALTSRLLKVQEGLTH